MKLNHKQKIKLARSMMTRRDIKRHIPKFQTSAWWKRYMKNIKKFKQWGIEINQPIS